jgi:hypothetical protein
MHALRMFHAAGYSLQILGSTGSVPQPRIQLGHIRSDNLCQRGFNRGKTRDILELVLDVL